jgi:hypothetical protein
MSRVIMLMLCGMWVGLVPAAERFDVAPDLWDRPRTADAVLNQPAVRQAVALYLARPASQVVIHHDVGQSSLMQAEELKNWLMALAIDGARIRLLNDMKPSEPMKIGILP